MNNQLATVLALEAFQRGGQDFAIAAGEPDEIGFETARLLKQELVAPSQIELPARRDSLRQRGQELARCQSAAKDFIAKAGDIALSDSRAGCARIRQSRSRLCG